MSKRGFGGTSNKAKSGFGVIWIPGRSKAHRHKYRTIDKQHLGKRETDQRFRPLPAAAYDNNISISETSVNSDMMSGDATLPSGAELKIDTTINKNLQIDEGAAAAVILLDEGDTKNDKIPIIDDDNNDNDDDNHKSSSSKDSANQTNNDDLLNDSKDTKSLMNKSLDNVDAIWKPQQLNNGKTPIKTDEKESEECVVKCLYYTIQCCECTIQ